MNINASNKSITTNKINTKRMVMVGMMAAISAILMFFEVRVPFAPEFIKLDFSELPIILCAFIGGPVAGILTAIVKMAIVLVFKGSSTMGVGEAMILLCSLGYMLPALFIYNKIKTKKGAAIGLLIGTLVTTVVAVIANYFVMYPLYAKAFGMPMEAIVGAAHAVNPLVNDLLSLMLFTMVPFNIIKFGLVSVLAFLVYKKLSGAIKRVID